MLTLSPDLQTPLVSQIVDGLRGLIVGQVLKPGSKLPSIRAFAAAHGVSVFTVVEAYDRLVAQGWLVDVQAAELKAEAMVKAGAKMTASAAALLKSPRVLRL